MEHEYRSKIQHFFDGVTLSHSSLHHLFRVIHLLWSTQRVKTLTLFFICIALIKSNFRDGLVKIYKEKIRAELLEKQICFRRHGVKGKKTIGGGTFLDSFTENKRFYWTPGRLVPFFFCYYFEKASLLRTKVWNLVHLSN